MGIAVITIAFLVMVGTRDLAGRAVRAGLALLVLLLLLPWFAALGEAALAAHPLAAVLLALVLLAAGWVRFRQQGAHAGHHGKAPAAEHPTSLKRRAPGGFHD